MSTRSFFGRVWQDSRRSMPSPSVGPMSAAPTLPVFTESTRAPGERTTANARSQTAQSGGVQQERPGPGSKKTTSSKTVKEPVTAPEVDGRPATVAFESLRFEPVSKAPLSHAWNARLPESPPSPGSPRALGVKKQKLISQPPSAEPLIGQANELPERALDNTAGPKSRPSVVTESTLPAQSKNAHHASVNDDETAPAMAVEKSSFDATRPEAKSETDKTAPTKSDAKLNRKPGKQPSSEPGSEPTQSPGLHIGEVRIRLIEEPKQAAPGRSSLTHTESDSRRLLRSL